MRKASLKPVTARQFRSVVLHYARAFNSWVHEPRATTGTFLADNSVEQEMRMAEERVMQMCHRLEAIAAEIARLRALLGEKA